MNTATPPNTTVAFRRRASDFQPSAKDTRRLSKMTQRESLKSQHGQWMRFIKAAMVGGIIIYLSVIALCIYAGFKLGRALGAW